MDEADTRHDDGQLEGRYANYFTIGHNAFEFVLDFGQFYEGEAAPRLHTRIITSPHCAKSLSATFRESLQRYEQQFGAIEVEEE